MHRNYWEREAYNQANKEETHSKNVHKQGTQAVNLYPLLNAR